jgi:hypothetical protein
MNMDSLLLWQIGAGGALTMLILREVFAFLREKTRNGAGSKSVDFWRMELRAAVNEGLTTTLKPLIETQIQLLREIRDSVATSYQGISELVVTNRGARRGR